MIPQKFFRNPNGSIGFHGTVGMTKVLWSAKYALEPQHLPIDILSLNMILGCKDCFLFFSKNILLQVLVGVVWNEKPTPVGTLFFFVNNIIFKITSRLLYLFLTVFPAYYFKACSCCLCQAQASSHQQLNVPSTKTFGNATQKSFDEKSWYHEQSLSIPETSRITEGFTDEIFWYSQTY